MYHDSFHVAIAEVVLDYFRERLIAEMDANAVIMELLAKGIINGGDQKKISICDPQQQNEKLHLCKEEMH